MNTVKTFLLMVVMSALLLLVGAMLGGIGGIIVALIIAIVMNFSAYWFSDRIALKMTHAAEITESEDPELYSIVREQASLAGLPMPKVFRIESDSPNAFATGRNPNHATVAVTTGIEKILNRNELGGGTTFLELSSMRKAAMGISGSITCFARTPILTAMILLM